MSTEIKEVLEITFSKEFINYIPYFIDMSRVISLQKYNAKIDCFNDYAKFIKKMSALAVEMQENKTLANASVLIYMYNLCLREIEKNTQEADSFVIKQKYLSELLIK